MKKVLIIFLMFICIISVTKAQQGTFVNSSTNTKSASDVKTIKSDDSKKGMTATSGSRLVAVDSSKNTSTKKIEATPANPFVREERKTSVEKK